MRRTGAVLGVLILVAVIAAAAQNDKGASTAAGASPSASPPSDGPGRGGANTPATRDIDPFVSLQMRILDLENKRPHPATEVVMWIALALVGVFLANAWTKIKDVEKAELAERYAHETKIAMWKELFQAVRPLSPDPQAALKDFATRLEAASGAIREVTGRAEGALKAIDARLDELSPKVAELEKRIAGVAGGPVGKP